MNETHRTILRRALPVVVLVVLGATAVIVIDSLRTHPENAADPLVAVDQPTDGNAAPVPSGPPAPGGLPDAQFEALRSAREALRAAGGASPESVVTIGRILTGIPEDRSGPLLFELRPDFRLALHSDSMDAALGVLVSLRTGVSKPGMRAAIADPTYRSVLLAALTHPAAGIRAKAVGLLPLLDTPMARADAIKALSDPEGSVRAAAAGAYVAFTKPPALQRLCSMFTLEADPAVRMVLLKAFGSAGRHLRRPAVFLAEEEAFQHGTIAEKLQVLANIQLWRDNDVVPDLLHTLRSDDAPLPLKEAVLTTLLVLRDPRCREHVRALAEDADAPQIRELAKKVLTAIGE